MSISVYSVFTAFLWFNLFIVILYILRKKLKDLFAYHFLPLSVAAVLCLARLFLPFEPPFALELESAHLFLLVLHVLRFNLITVGTVNISVGIVILVCLSLVAIRRFYKALKPVYRTFKKAAGYAPTDNPRMLSIFEKVKSESPSRCKCKLCVTDDYQEPLIAGFIFSVIIFPEKLLSLSDENIYHILKYEWQHHRKKDNLIKLLFQVLRCIMWWNPLVPLLCPIIITLLEFKCDANTMKGASPEKALGYFETVKDVIALHTSKTSDISKDDLISASFLGTDNGTTAVERWDVFFRDNNLNRKNVIVSIVCLIALFLVSFCFVIQPFITPPENDILSDSTSYSTLEVTPETSYLVNNKDGTYSLFVNGVFWNTILAEDINHAPHQSLPIIE